MHQYLSASLSVNYSSCILLITSISVTQVKCSATGLPSRNIFTSGATFEARAACSMLQNALTITRSEVHSICAASACFWLTEQPVLLPCSALAFIQPTSSTSLSAPPTVSCNCTTGAANSAVPSSAQSRTANDSTNADTMQLPTTT